MSPFARAVRTFAAGMVGVLATVVIAVQASDYKAGVTLLTLGAATALVAGIIAFCTAAAGMVANTPFGKAVATFLQFIVASVPTVAFTSFADVVAFGHAAVPIIVAGLVAAAQTFVQNFAEARSA